MSTRWFVALNVAALGVTATNWIAALLATQAFHPWRQTCRIGPLPYCRSGGHTEEALVWVAGPGIEPGVQLPDGRPTSLAPTLLALLGAPIPLHMRQPTLI